MQYRAVSEQERLELMELQAQAFFFTYDRERYADQMAGGDPRKSGRVVFDEQGKLAAGMELIPFDCWLDGNAVGMGGVAGVASWPERRNEGFVKELMRQAINEMHERGDVFSFLYSFSNRFYRKFGYEACYKALRVKAPLEPLQAWKQPGSAVRFIPGKDGSDPGPIIEIYNDFAWRYNLALDREGWRWHGLLETDPMKTKRQAYIWHGEDGQPGAYVLFRAEPDNEPEVLHVLEAGWKTLEALKGLLGFLGGFGSNLKTIDWELPPDLDPNLIWPECKAVKTELIHDGMCRVVNAAKALRLMAKPEGKGSVRVSLSDDGLPANTGVYKIDWENGEGHVRRAKGAADLECSVQALSQLVTGYLPLEQLRFRDDVTVNSKAEELGKLFRMKSIYLQDKF